MQRQFIQFTNRNSTIIQNIRILEPSGVVFVYDRHTFIFDWDENDPGYFKFMLPNIDTYTSQKSTIILELQKQFKIGKCVIVDKNLWLVVEQVVTNMENIDILFLRSLNILSEMWSRYGQQIATQSQQNFIEQNSPNTINQ